MTKKQIPEEKEKSWAWRKKPQTGLDWGPVAREACKEKKNGKVEKRPTPFRTPKKRAVRDDPTDLWTETNRTLRPDRTAQRIGGKKTKNRGCAMEKPREKKENENWFKGPDYLPAGPGMEKGVRGEDYETNQFGDLNRPISTVSKNKIRGTKNVGKRPYVLWTRWEKDREKNLGKGRRGKARPPFRKTL